MWDLYEDHSHYSPWYNELLDGGRVRFSTGKTRTIGSKLCGWESLQVDSCVRVLYTLSDNTHTIVKTSQKSLLRVISLRSFSWLRENRKRGLGEEGVTTKGRVFVYGGSSTGSNVFRLRDRVEARWREDVTRVRRRGRTQKGLCSNETTTTETEVGGSQKGYSSTSSERT